MDSPTFSCPQPSAFDTAFANGQSLASVLNNPNTQINTARLLQTWLTPASHQTGVTDGPAPLAPGILPIVTLADFRPYLERNAESFGKFTDIRLHATSEESERRQSIDGSNTNGTDGTIEVRGEGLAACMGEIPPSYFAEDFSLENGLNFQAALPASLMLQEKLSHYLDLVEVHLVAEISCRSADFFDALEELEELNLRLVSACDSIAVLQDSVRLIEEDLIRTAERCHVAAKQRKALVELHQSLHVLDYVNQALATLRMEGEELHGLHCFRDLGTHLSQAAESVNSLLLADFVSAAIHGNADLEPDALRTAAIGRQKLGSKAAESIGMQEVFSGEALAGLGEQLHPLIFGLLRTGQLPAVLRSYRSVLTVDLKAAIKCTLAAHVSNASAAEGGGGGGGGGGEGGAQSLTGKLQRLSPDDFCQLLIAIFAVVQPRLLRAKAIASVVDKVVEEGGGEASTTHPSQQFRSDILKENSDTLWSACDTAHARWSKLISLRPPPTTLPHFTPLYSLTSTFITATEGAGGRLGYGLRGTLHAHAKAFVDGQHAKRVSDLVTVLDNEVWAAVDASPSSQTIVDSWEEEAAQLKGEEEGAQAPLPTLAEVGEGGGGTDVQNVGGAEKEGGGEGVGGGGGSEAGEGREGGEGAGGGEGGAEQETGGKNEVEAAAVDADSLPPPGKEEDGLSTGGKAESAPPVAIPDDPPPGGAAQAAEVGRKPPSKGVKCLLVKGEQYHAVHCALVMLRLVDDSLTLSHALPALATEVVHRTGELLKLYNSRTCQLVLGAAAMQTAGLKSITAKHLALASQSVSLMFALMGDVRRLLGLYIPPARKSFLFNEIDRVIQDYGVHREEIHNKLVGIMRERLAVHLRQLPMGTDKWNAPEGEGEGEEAQPTQFARALTKEVGVLHRVLSPLLLAADLRSIFARVVALFHVQLTDTFSKIEINTPQGKRRLYRDIALILQCMRTLPSPPVNEGSDMRGGRELDHFVAQKFGEDPPP